MEDREAMDVRWEDKHQGWTKVKRRCQYGTIIPDAVIGLFQSGNEAFYEAICEAMEDDGQNKGLEDEHIAVWLGEPIQVNGLETNWIMRVFGEFTSIVQARIRTGSQEA